MLIPAPVEIHLSIQPTDMRKSINGLMALVVERMELDPQSGHLFLFRNKRGDKLKTLYYERDCFTLWYRRLEKGKFKFPTLDVPHVEISQEQFQWLLNSFDFARMSPIQSQPYHYYF